MYSFNLTEIKSYRNPHWSASKKYWFGHLGFFILWFLFATDRNKIYLWIYTDLLPKSIDIANWVIYYNNLMQGTISSVCIIYHHWLLFFELCIWNFSERHIISVLINDMYRNISIYQYLSCYHSKVVSL